MAINNGKNISYSILLSGFRDLKTKSRRTCQLFIFILPHTSSEGRDCRACYLLNGGRSLGKGRKHRDLKKLLNI